MQKKLQQKPQEVIMISFCILPIRSVNLQNTTMMPIHQAKLSGMPIGWSGFLMVIKTRKRFVRAMRLRSSIFVIMQSFSMQNPGMCQEMSLKLGEVVLMRGMS